jgi:hypothetical protein
MLHQGSLVVFRTRLAVGTQLAARCKGGFTLQKGSRQFLSVIIAALLILGSASSPVSAGSIITDTISADGRVWVQPDVFYPQSGVLSWYDVDAMCPAGICSGDWDINGTIYDMNGWMWASVDDVNSLFNSYLVGDILGSGPDYYWGNGITEVFFDDGWRPTFEAVTGNYISVSAWTSTTNPEFPDFAYEGSVSDATSGINTDQWQTSAYGHKNSYHSTLPSLRGAWLYREQEIPLPSTLVLLLSALLLCVMRPGLGQGHRFQQ